MSRDGDSRGGARGGRLVWAAALALVAAGFALGLLARGGGRESTSPAAEATSTAPTRWTCSMHPQIILPSNDQKCPICFMDLIPLEEDSGAAVGADELALSEAAAALADIAAVPARRDFVTRPLRLVGKVAADETRTRSITARVGGRLDRLYVDATGQTVTPGMKLAEIYSPELYTAQAEVQAAARAAAASRAETGALSGSADATLKAAVERLRLWGLGEDQIQAILDGGRISEHVTVKAPLGGVVVRRVATQGDYVNTGSVLYTIADLSKVWATLEAFETDVAWLRVGQAVTFTTRAYPGRGFSGEILFIDPVLDERTRTVEVRVELDNAEGLLKPGMLVSAAVEAALDADGRPVTDRATARPPLVIPASAPLLTGTRAVVYIKTEGEDGPVFTGRQVRLGPRAGDHYLVVDGISEGELVVMRGNFKIDSALQILAKPSMMNPAADGGAAPDVEKDDAAAPALAGVDLPACAAEILAGALPDYYALQAALAADDDGAAAAAVGRLADRLAAADCDVSALAPAQREAWDGLLAALRRAAADAVAAGDIDHRRLAFEPLSDGLWAGLAQVPDLPDTVRRFHCPMAMDGAGAYWLQPGDVTANPYYGAAMLRCGSQVEVVGGGE